METPPRDGGVDMEEFWSVRSGSVRLSPEHTLSALVFLHTSSSHGTGGHGAGVAEAMSVCISPDRSAPRGSTKAPAAWDQLAPSSLVLASPGMVFRHNSSPSRPSVANSYQEGPSISDRGHNISPSAGAVEAVGLAPKGGHTRIPQVIVMTKVDLVCPLVSKDLRKIYTSKKIREKMQVCSDKIGVPMNHIFPVKNYSEEIDTDDDADVLILKALDQIVNLANDRLRDAASN
ncbi:unnamed protein product [Leuciscus chuanchicus]